jgi:hypothetical protein
MPDPFDLSTLPVNPHANNVNSFLKCSKSSLQIRSRNALIAPNLEPKNEEPKTTNSFQNLENLQVTSPEETAHQKNQKTSQTALKLAPFMPDPYNPFIPPPAYLDSHLCPVLRVIPNSSLSSLTVNRPLCAKLINLNSAVEKLK